MSNQFIKIAFIFFFTVSFAQTKDSLYVKQLLIQSKELKQTSNTESTLLLKEAIEVSLATKYYFGAFEAHIQIGILNYYKGEHHISIAHYKSALAIISEHIPGNKDQIGRCYFNIGTACYELENYEAATKNYLRALDYYTEENKLRIMSSYHELGLIYVRFHQYDLAIAYFKKANKIAKQTNNNSYLAKALINFGIISDRKKDFTKASKYYDEALLLVASSDNIYNKILLNKAVSNHFLTLKKTNEALSYALKAHKLAEKHEINVIQARTLTLLADIYSIQNKRTLAINTYLKAKDKANLYKNLSLKSSVIYALAQLYSENKEYKKAFRYSEEHKQLSDSLVNAKNIRLIANSTALYESEKKDKEILVQTSKIKAQENLLLKRNNRNLYLIASLICIAFIGFWFYQKKIYNVKELYNKRLKKINKRLQRINEMLKKSRANALVAMEAKASILNNITHELKTPLQTISSVSLLLSNEGQTSTQKKYMDTIDFSVKNLLNLINNAITLNSDQKEKAKLNLNPFNLTKTVNNIATVMNVIGLNNKLHVLLDPKIKYLELIGDEPKLIQILNNLLGNANKYTNSGSITLQIDILKINRKEVCIQFNVSDTGVGIAPSDLDKIFTPFYRVSEALTSKTTGSGLGLSIVQNLISAHNSKIVVASEKGKGTSFKFEFNYEIASVAEKEQKINPPDIKVLIVEDHKINQLLIKKNIEQEGFVCKIASNGLEAVNLVKNEKFDIILTDIMMPIMDGFESSKIIKEMYSNLPIIAITAVSENEERQKFEEAQIHTVINKPINTKELFKSIYIELNISKLDLSA